MPGYAPRVTIEALRTPEERFVDLPDFPYQPMYVDDLVGYEGLRMHYVDEGPDDGEVFLCLHGEPTWAYLYRKMIPVFTAAGVRVVAPDFYGFGRSDKPVDEAAHTWSFHRGSLTRFIERLDLRDITLVVQDWGGLLGLSLAADMGERIRGVLVMNTSFAVGVELTPGFMAWRDWVAANPDFEVGRLMKRSCPHLTPEEVAAYDAPFPDPSYRGAVRRFPAIVPTDPSMEGVDISQRALRWWSEEFDGRSFMAVGAADPVLASVMPWVRRHIRNCPEPLVLEEAGHFVQEWGDVVAEAALTHWGM